MAVPESIARGQLDSGLLGQTGETVAQTANTQATTGLNQAQFTLQNQPVQLATQRQDWVNAYSKSVNLDPTELGNAIVTAQRQGQRINTIEDIKDVASQLQLNRGNFERTQQPITQGTEALENTFRNYMAGYQPDALVSSPYLSRVGLNGVQPSGGQLSPSFRPQAAAMLGAIQRGQYGMGDSGTTMTTPSGIRIVAPPAAPSISTPTTYMPGSSGVIGESNRKEVPLDYLNNAIKYEPMKFNPNILVNPETQRAIDKTSGQDITTQVNSNPALVHQIAQELKDKQDTEKTNAKKVEDAKHVVHMDEFMKAQDARAKSKSYGGLVGGIRDANTAIGNTLIGDAASSVGNYTSNLHPWDAYKNRLVNDYKDARRVLIGD
jgi:hypothetical protein